MSVGWQELVVAVVVGFAAAYVLRVLLRASGIGPGGGGGPKRDSNTPDVPVDKLVRKKPRRPPED